MQAVILAAGRGTRMGALTESVPKPLLPLGSKNLIEHKLDNLPPLVGEIIFVVSERDGAIEQYFGSDFRGRRIVYAVQGELAGSAGALWAAQSFLKGSFLVMAGDDLYGAATLKAAAERKWSMTVSPVIAWPKPFNNIIPDASGDLARIIFDDTSAPARGLIDACLYHFGLEIFEYDPVLIPGTNEYGLPHTVAQVARDIPIHILEAEFWQQLNTPEDLRAAEKALGL